MMKTNRRGTTLVEIMIAAAVLAIMMAFVMLIFHNALVSGNNQGKQGDLDIRGRRALDRLRADFATARFATVGFAGGVFDHHCTVRYQMPLSLGSGGIQTYGAIDKDGTLLTGGWYELAFVGDTIIRETSGPTPTTTAQVPSGTRTITFDRDLNRDGDTSDTFVSGRLLIRAFDSLGTLMHTGPMDDYVLLRVRPDDLSALDGNLLNNATPSGSPLDLVPFDTAFILLTSTDTEVPNPVISTSARKMRLRLWHVNFDEQERSFLMFKNEDQVRLDNPQS